MKKFIHSAVLGSLFFISCQNMAYGAPHAPPWSNSDSDPALKTYVVNLKTGDREDELLIKNSAPSQAEGTRKQLRQRHPWRTVGIVTLSVGAVAGLCVGGYFWYPVIFGAIASTISPSENSTQTDSPPVSSIMDSPEWEPIAPQCPHGMKEIGSGSTCRFGETSATHNWGEPWLNSEISAICSEDIWLNCAKSTAAQGCPSGTHRGSTYDGSFRDVFGRCEWKGSRQLLPDGSETVVCENGSWHQCEKDPSIPKPTTTTTSTTTTPKPDLQCPRGMKEIGSGASCTPGETSATHNWDELWKGPAVAICPKDGVWRLCADRKGARGCPSGTHPGNTYDGNFRAVFWQCELENYSQSLPCQKGIVVCHDKSWMWCEKDPSTPKPMPEPEISTTLPPVNPDLTERGDESEASASGSGGDNNESWWFNMACPRGMQDDGIIPGPNGQAYPCYPPGHYLQQSCGRILGCGGDSTWHICRIGDANGPQFPFPTQPPSSGQAFGITLTCSEGISRHGISNVFSCQHPEVIRAFHNCLPYVQKLTQLIGFMPGGDSLQVSIGFVEFPIINFSQTLADATTIRQNMWGMPVQAEIRMGLRSNPVVIMHELLHPLIEQTAQFQYQVNANGGYFCVPVQAGQKCVGFSGDGHFTGQDPNGRRVNAQPLLSGSAGPVADRIDPFITLVLHQLKYKVRDVANAQQAFEWELQRGAYEEAAPNKTKTWGCGAESMHYDGAPPPCE